MAALIELASQLANPSGRKYAVMEGNLDCNRRCSSCIVPQRYSKQQELTVEETCFTIDWLHSERYRFLSYLGGEPFAPFKTKEGITFFEHTRRVVEYATKKGMIMNVTTNGDYVDSEEINLLKQAGLSTLTYSLHSYTNEGFNHLIKTARLTAEAGILSEIQTVLTKDTAEKIPGVAAAAARNGLLFSVGLVQEKGGGFSNIPENSFLPSVDDQRKVFGALLRLKTFGFLVNTRDYLMHAPDFYPNNWTCDPERDSFIHIGAGAQGTVNVCCDVRTDLRIQDIGTLDSPIWREKKRDLVRNCGNCLFHCYFETQRSDWIGDAPTGVLVGLIKTGHTEVVRRLGDMAVRLSQAREKNFTYELQF